MKHRYHLDVVFQFMLEYYLFEVINMEIGSIADWVSGIATFLSSIVAIGLGYLSYRRELKSRNEQIKKHKIDVDKILERGSNLLNLLKVEDRNSLRIHGSVRYLNMEDVDKIATESVMFDNKLHIAFPSISLAVSPYIYTFKEQLLSSDHYENAAVIDDEIWTKFELALTTLENIISIVDEDKQENTFKQ
ncbi:hypothetical protein [Lacticaseibacillus paracasei]|jgi:hypothetical protein|uniref:Uncharacterized protein n=1 Tax=Lacticaseibacillus paracasei TaxID=1597 RepID=A0AAW6A5L8_LACPA|nr:hypothetical protein [Lacticaseibacillus paracasei]MDB1564744.1 hypothetical protein [Lacticaseibacillus paracasei]